MDLREIGCGSIDWNDLVQDRDQWRALVNMGRRLLKKLANNNIIIRCVIIYLPRNYSNKRSMLEFRFKIIF
jgi:hypothetical protein